MVCGARHGAQQSAGEGIARTGRIAHRLQRMGRREEDAIFGEQKGAILAALDDDGARPVGEDDARGRREKALPGELHGFFIVHQHTVDSPQQALEPGTGSVEPELHRVAGDELRIGHLLQHLELQLRLDIGQEDQLRVAVRRGQRRMEIGEDVELGVQRLPILQPDAGVARGPSKGLSGTHLQTREIDVARFQQLLVLERKVLAHHPHQANGCKQRGR